MRILFTLIILLFLTSCATLRPGGHYYVRNGDTLWLIAKRSKVSVASIMAANKTIKPNSLLVGQKLNIPDKGAYYEDAPKKQTYLNRTQAPDSSTINLAWPIEKPVVLRLFSPKAKDPYLGVSLGSPRGTEVKAAAPGKVVFAGDQENHFGRFIIIDHENSFMTVYAHLDKISIQTGDKVAKGQTIGELGTSGQVDSPMLHFEVRKNRVSVDPMTYLP